MKKLLALLLASTTFAAQAQTVVTINNLAPAATLSGTEPVPIWQNGGAVRTTPAAIAALVGGVTSFNARNGVVTLQGTDVATALGYTPVGASGSVPFTGQQTFAAATTGRGSFLVTPGTAPTGGALQNGVCWLDTASLWCRVNGASQEYAAGGIAGVSSFNTRTGAVTLSSGDVTTALTYTPLNPANNLSDVSNASTARTSLGVAYGTAAGTVAQGNDSRFAGPTQNSQSTAYGFVLADAGKQVYHPSADTTARIWTIPANGSVAYAVGTKIEIVNDCSAGVITLAITSDTLAWFPAGTTGSRSIAACGTATATKIATTRWMLTGVGVS